jgi:CheY-like chemotaxis protein
MIRVALVHDQAIVRAGLARILSPANGFEVLGEIVEGRQPVAELPPVHRDVVLMDIRMPALEGVSATARLRGLEVPLSVLVLTTFGEDEVSWGADRGRGCRVRAQGQLRGGPDRRGTGRRRRRGLVRSGSRAAPPRALSKGGGAGGP